MSQLYFEHMRSKSVPIKNGIGVNSGTYGRWGVCTITSIDGSDISNGAKGEPCFVRGFVRGIDGKPLAGARIEVWQADEDGFYDVQYAALEESRARATLTSSPDGAYRFRSIVANPYPIPHDGPVGTDRKSVV